MKIAIAVKTMDRAPRRNFLGATLANLARAGVFDSEHFHSLTLVDSGSPDFQAFWNAEVGAALPTKYRDKIARDLPDEGGRRTLHQNAARAIRVAARAGADLALVIEDDIDVVDGFLETVAAWFRDHEEPGQMYVLGANYARVQYLAGLGRTRWEYPCDKFYGAQALLWRTETAAAVAEWLGEDPDFEGDRTRSHDLLLGKWGAEAGPGHFVASVPSLVQHIGNESSIGNEPFVFPSFPGHGYEYPGRRPVALWVGDATVSTGFARCTRAACDALYRAGWEVHVLGLHYYGDPHELPYQVWPPTQPWDGGRDVYGVSRLPALVERLAPDVVVVLNDPWNVPAYLDSLDGFAAQRREQNLFFSRPPVVGWLAVDGKNQRGAPLNRLARVVTWTRFASEELKRGGYEGEPDVVPLGVDPECFYPVDRAESRAAVLPDSVPPDAFVVGVVGRNQPRKRLDLTLEYFAEWVRLHHVEDAYLLLHVAPTGEAGCDVRSLVKYHGLAGRVVLSQPHVGIGADLEHLRATYGAMDVYVTTTQGEGWGLPALEAMACAVPCIVPRWSALGDWPGTAAVTVGCSSTALTAPMNGNPYTIGGIADKKTFIQELDAMYRSELHREAYRKRGLALARGLTWERTGREMVAVLERVVKEGGGVDAREETTVVDEENAA